MKKKGQLDDYKPYWNLLILLLKLNVISNRQFGFYLTHIPRTMDLKDL